MTIKGSPRSGYRVLNCAQCEQRRKVWRLLDIHDCEVWRCSQGHTWGVEKLTLQKVNDILKEVFQTHISDYVNYQSPLVDFLKQAR